MNIKSSEITGPWAPLKKTRKSFCKISDIFLRDFEKTTKM